MAPKGVFKTVTCAHEVKSLYRALHHNYHRQKKPWSFREKDGLWDVKGVGYQTVKSIEEVGVLGDKILGWAFEV